MAPAHCTTNLNLQDRVDFCACAYLVETNHNWAPSAGPTHSKHPFTCLTWEVWHLSTNEGDLLRKSCHETGSQEPINAIDFLPWHYLNSEEGGGGWGCEKKRNRHKSVVMEAPQLYLSSHSLHPPTLQPAIVNPFLSPPSCYSFAFPSFLLFVCPWAENSVCVYVLHYVCVCLCEWVCVRVCESALKWRIDSQCSIFSHLAHYYSASQSALYFSLSLSLSLLLSPYFCASLSLFLCITVSYWWMEVFTRGVVLPLQETFLEYQQYVLYLCMLLCISVCYSLTWNTLLSIQECMLFLCTVWGHMVVLRPTVYCISDSAFEWMPDLLFYLYFCCVCVYLYVWGRICWWVSAPEGLYTLH